VCGDHKVVGPEVCDDGNQRSGDGCSADCLSTEVCGNGYIDAVVGEECDSGIAGLSRDGCSSTCTLEVDTWFDISPTAPASGFRPPMAFDSLRRRVVLFTPASADGDAKTYDWDGLVWHNLDAFGPTAAFAGLAFDEARGVMVLFGGEAASGLSNETWTWDGIAWTKMAPTTSPPGRHGMAMAYDATRHEVVMSGGNGMTDTWVWDGANWSERTGATSPPSCDLCSMAYDSSTSQVITLAASGDTWAWDGTQWTKLAASLPARIQDALVSVPNGVLLYGGSDPVSGNQLHETWKWSNGTWTKLVPTNNPGDRVFATMAYDSARNRAVLYGDFASSTTWEWDGTNWDLITPIFDPGSAGSNTAAYDATRGRGVLFDRTANEVWEWDGAWHDVAHTPAMAGRNGNILVGARDHVLLLGGIASNPEMQTWMWDGTTWTQRTSNTTPSARWWMSATYDIHRGKVVMFGGATSATVTSSTPALAETWEWDGTDWTQRQPAHMPSPHVFATLAYDPIRERVVLYGDGGVLAYDTWEWDGNDWTERTPALSPAVTNAIAMYDAARQRVLLVGIVVFSAHTAAFEWDGTTWTVQTPTVAVNGVAGETAFYDAVRATTIMYGVAGSAGQTWSYHYYNDSEHMDACVDVDTDGDGLAGCADPDCWGRCTPFCPPGATCDPSWPRCGDGVCSSLENHRLCPLDCS
jgi:cysteine-rich repeat protein